MHGNEWGLAIVVIIIIGYFILNYENSIREHLKKIWYKFLKCLTIY